MCVSYIWSYIIDLRRRCSLSHSNPCMNGFTGSMIDIIWLHTLWELSWVGLIRAKYHYRVNNFHYRKVYGCVSKYDELFSTMLMLGPDYSCRTLLMILLIVSPGQHQQCHGLVQERRNSSVLTMELRLSCINHRMVLFMWIMWNIFFSSLCTETNIKE